MTCEAWRDLLQQHLDGGPADALEAHLAACPACAAQRHAIRRLLLGVALLSPPAPPPGLTARVTDLVGRERKAGQRRRLAAWLGAAAAAVLVALGARSWLPVAGETRPPGGM